MQMRLGRAHRAQQPARLRAGLLRLIWRAGRLCLARPRRVPGTIRAASRATLATLSCTHTRSLWHLELKTALTLQATQMCVCGKSTPTLIRVLIFN